MLYYWIAFAVGMLFYAAYLSQPMLVSLGMAYMKDSQKSPSLPWLFTRLLAAIARLLPALLMRPVPLLLWMGGLGLTVYQAFSL
ncbi:MAG: hypothetical protein ACN6OD_18480 [Alcaligenes sp.]